MDLETELYQLEQRRLALVKSRDEVLDYLEREIDETNRQFDQAVIPLGRQINELRERLKLDEKTADKPRRQRKLKAVVMDGLDDEDRAHFQELLAAKRGR